MAELAHLRLERTIPELEEMGRIGLFSKEEIRAIVKKRKPLENKLCRKRKKDFLKYIEYEMTVLSLISKRRERLLCESKKQEIDHKVAKRISRLFKGVIGRFPDDQKLNLDHIQFCKKMKWYDNLNILHSEMLKVHSKNPSLWIMAAKWEMEERRLPENARKILQRGVLINPKSKLLWREYFRMELMYTDLIRKRREVLLQQKMEDPEAVENDVILSGKISIIVYEKALEEIDDDVEFALSFIQICLEFDFSSKLVDHIFEKVLEKFPEEEETFDAIAKRPLLNIEEKIKLGKEQGIKKRVTLERINEEIFSKYEEAIECKATEKMWSFYIDFVRSLFKENKKKDRKEGSKENKKKNGKEGSKENKKKDLQEKLIKLMERAASFNCLSVTYYPEWIDLLFERGDKNDALVISLTAARKWHEVDLWCKALIYHIQCMQPSKQIYQYLIEAINSVPEKDTVKLWELEIYWLSLLDPEKLIEFFEYGIKKRKKICAPLKEMYLEKTALNSGLEATRILYKKFRKRGLICHHVVRKMVDLESRLKPSIDLLRQYYENGIQEFGSTNIDIWLDYMKLESEHENGDSTSYGTLIYRAKRTLQPEYLGDFQTRLTQFMTGSSIPHNVLLSVQ